MSNHDHPCKHCGEDMRHLNDRHEAVCKKNTCNYPKCGCEFEVCDDASREIGEKKNAVKERVANQRATDDGFVPWTQPWIVCAACKNADHGMVVTGARHFDRVMKVAIEAMASPRAHDDEDAMLRHWRYGWSQADQGFIDQWGRFYTRGEAAQLAVQNKQCDPGINYLFSEDLY